jgi:hypothetical protein
MIIREYGEADYVHLSAAWQKHQWVPCPSAMLPDYGLVAYRGGTFLSYMGMYVTKAGGFIDWAVRNPDADREEAMAGLDEIFSRLTAEAKKRGCRFVYSVTKNEAWKKRLLSYGMSIAEEGVTSFAMAFGGEDLTFISDDD